MTKTVKLTKAYILFAEAAVLNSGKYPTHNGAMYCHIDRSNTFIDDTGVTIEDIEAAHEAGHNNAQLYNQKIDLDEKSINYGKQTIDLNSPHSMVNVPCYDFDDNNSQVTIPDSIFNELRNLKRDPQGNPVLDENGNEIEIGIVEEVI